MNQANQTPRRTRLLESTLGKTDIPFSKYTVVNLCNGEGEDKCHLDVPYLITTDQISNPILGFNAIKQIAQTTGYKLLLFQTSFDQTDAN